MRTDIRLPLTLSVFGLLLGCGPTEEAPVATTTPAGSLRLSPVGDVAAALPARVSVRFTAQTATGVPVTTLSSASLELYEDGVPVSGRESQQRLVPQSEGYRISSLVMLDVSGSILRSGDFNALVDAARAYAKTVLARGDQAQRVGLATFDGRERPQMVVPFTSDLVALESGLDSLLVEECRAATDCAAYPDRRACAGFRCVDDSTNLYGAVVNGLSLVALAQQQSDGAKYTDGALLLFTDGADQASRVPRADALKAVGSSPAHVFTVGLGPEADLTSLKALGKDGTFAAAAADALGKAFSEVAAQVSGLANRTYQLDYCSPRRSGKHDLEIVATVPAGTTSLKGTLRAGFDATGFGSGCAL